MPTLHEIKEIVEKSNITLDVPVCVPSYKFRDEAWLVHNLDKIETQVYLFVYEDDYTESGYDKFNWSDNVTIVKIKEQDFKDLNIRWRGIQPKRRYIQIYMDKLGIKNYFMIDDDYSDNFYYPSENGLVHISISNFLKTVYSVSLNIPEFIIIGVVDENYYRKIGIENKIENTYYDFIVNGVAVGFYYFNNNPYNFSDEIINEDLDLYVRTINKNIGIIPYLFTINNTENCDSVTYNDNLPLNTYLKYPDKFDLRLLSNRKLTIKFMYADLNNGKTDESLYNIAITRDINKLKEFLLHRRYN